MDFLTIAVVDAVHAEVIREALEAAGVTCNIIGLHTSHQADPLRRRQRQLIDVQVLESDEARARAALLLLEIEAGEAARAEAGGGDELVSDDDRRLEEALRRPRTEPLSPGFGLLLALVFPVAGPIYAGASRLTFASAAAHAAGFLIYLLAAGHHWYRNDLHLELGMMVIVAARFLDVVGTVQAVARHNARLEERPDDETKE